MEKKIKKNWADNKEDALISQQQRATSLNLIDKASYEIGDDLVNQHLTKE